MIYEIFWFYFGIILCVNLEREKKSNFICALFLQLNHNLTFLHADASCFILWRGSFLIINFQIIYICADLYGYLNTGKYFAYIYFYIGEVMPWGSSLLLKISLDLDNHKLFCQMRRNEDLLTIDSGNNYCSFIFISLFTVYRRVKRIDK